MGSRAFPNPPARPMRSSARQQPHRILDLPGPEDRYAKDWFLMRALPTLIFSWLATGGAAAAGSILGNAAGARGLRIGAVIGGVLGLLVSVLGASRLSWLPTSETRGAFLGGLVGFALGHSDHPYPHGESDHSGPELRSSRGWRPGRGRHLARLAPEGLATNQVPVRRGQRGCYEGRFRWPRSGHPDIARRFTAQPQRRPVSHNVPHTQGPPFARDRFQRTQPSRA